MCAADTAPTKVPMQAPHNSKVQIGQYCIGIALRDNACKHSHEVPHHARKGNLSIKLHRSGYNESLNPKPFSYDAKLAFMLPVA